MKTIEEITEYIENTEHDGTDECSLRLGNAILWLCEVVKSQEKKLADTESSARHANNIASCLANGIQPD